MREFAVPYYEDEGVLPLQNFASQRHVSSFLLGLDRLRHVLLLLGLDGHKIKVGMPAAWSIMEPRNSYL